MSLTFQSNREIGPSGPSPRGLPGRSADALVCGGLAASVLFLPSGTFARQALVSSLSGEAPIGTNVIRLDSLPYTFKKGDFRLLLTPSLGLDWNDNINVSRTNTQEDFILKPALQINASYPVSQQNLLRLNVGVLYSRYLVHTGLSALQLRTGSDVSFDVYIRDVSLNFHDHISYVEDPALQPELAGTGSASLATLNNSAGLGLNWDLERVTLSSGYDHVNVISSTSQFDSEDHATESFFGRAGFKLNPALTSGVEASAAFTSYDQMILNDNAIYNAGVYGVWQPGRYFQVQPRAGYTVSQFQHTSASLQTSGQNSWYAGLKVSHEPGDHFEYSLDAGHNVQLGIQSDAVEVTYVRPSLQLNLIQGLGLGSSLSYEHGVQGAGNVAGNLTEIFDQYSAVLTLSCSLTKKLALSANYRLTFRSSSDATRDYTQNVVGMSLSYRP